MSIGVVDPSPDECCEVGPFPLEQEFAEFGRPRSSSYFGEVADIGEVVGFLEVINWPELPAEGWVGDALERIPLLSASDGELLDAAAAWDQLAAWVAGNQARVVAEFGSRRRLPVDMPAEEVAELAENALDIEIDHSATEELSLALRVAPVTARHRMRLALDLAGRLPAALGRMCAGELSWSKAKTLSDQAENLTPQQCATLQERVLDFAVGRTPGQFRDRSAGRL